MSGLHWYDRLPPLGRRSILNVYILDIETGEVLADVDALSTADAVAYYLASRHIDDDATEATIIDQVVRGGGYEAPEVEIAHERRNPISQALELGLVARVHKPAVTA